MEFGVAQMKFGGYKYHAVAVFASATSIRNTRKRLSHRRTFVVKASEKDDETPSFNPFGFVTDNESSRTAIQLPDSPAEDGNVGQMLYRIEDKGREYGSYIKSGGFRWFVRETGSSEARLGPRGKVVFLHGAPTQSYSYRVVMSQVSFYAINDEDLQGCSTLRHSEKKNHFVSFYRQQTRFYRRSRGEGKYDMRGGSGRGGYFSIDNGSLNTPSMAEGGTKMFFDLHVSHDQNDLVIYCKSNVDHPNIQANGHVNVNILVGEWSPILNISTVVLALYQMFKEEGQFGLFRQLLRNIKNFGRTFTRIWKNTHWFWCSIFSIIFGSWNVGHFGYLQKWFKYKMDIWNCLLGIFLVVSVIGYLPTLINTNISFLFMPCVISSPSYFLAMWHFLLSSSS